MFKRDPVCQDVVDRRAQGEKVVTEADRTARLHLGARIRRVPKARVGAGLDDRVEVGQLHFEQSIAARHDVLGAYVPVHEVHSVQRLEAQADLAHPVEQERGDGPTSTFRGAILECDLHHADVVVEGYPVDPLDQAHHGRRRPRTRDLVDGRDVLRSRSVLLCKAVGSCRDLRYRFLVDRLGDVRAKVIAVARVNFNDLEGHPDSTAAKAFNNPVVRVTERHDVGFVPEFRPQWLDGSG